MNKRAQYYPAPSYTSVHPLLVLGVGIFIVTFLFPAINIELGSILKQIMRVISYIVIIIGSALSIMKALD